MEDMGDASLRDELFGEEALVEKNEGQLHTYGRDVPFFRARRDRRPMRIGTELEERRVELIRQGGAYDEVGGANDLGQSHDLDDGHLKEVGNELQASARKAIDRAIAAKDRVPVARLDLKSSVQIPCVDALPTSFLLDGFDEGKAGQRGRNMVGQDILHGVNSF